MVTNRSKYPFMIEMILVPIVFLLLFFAFEAVYILGSSGGIVLIWWATAVISPRTGTPGQFENKLHVHSVKHRIL